MNAPRGRPSVGYVVSGKSRDYITRLEAAGADSMWAGGHISSKNPTPEAVIGVSQLAAHTTRCLVGTASLILPLYPPAIVAKQFADLDRLTGGRVVLGAGVGGEYESDFSACQVPASERGRRFDEAVPLLRELWKGRPVTSEGPCFPMVQVRIHPEPVRIGGPPILIAGRRQRAMVRAAEYGDGWLPYMYSPGRYHESVHKISALAHDQGRSLDGFSWALWTFVSVAKSGVEARRRAATRLAGLGHIADSKIVDHITVSGSIDQVGRRLHEYRDAGVEHFIFASIEDDDQERTDLLIQRELAGSLRGDQPDVEPE